VEVVPEAESGRCDAEHMGELEQQRRETSLKIRARDDRRGGCALGRRQGYNKNSDVVLVRGSNTVNKKRART
jgi:hypothetical protein